MEEMMSKMIQGMNPKDMMELIHSTMPKMMEHVLSEVKVEERRKMFSFCRNMMSEMEKKFS